MTDLAAQLAACSTEPIHIPGAIQPHGYLCTLDPDSLAIVQHSANLHELPGLTLAVDGAVNGAVVHSLVDIGADLADSVRAALDAHELRRPLMLGTFAVGSLRCDALLHRSDERTLVLELEPTERVAGEGFAAMQSLVRSLSAIATDDDSLVALCEFAAREMHAITGFGRTLVYRFDADGHGEVLAEHCESGYESYIGHRFPASDIPSQARALYLRNPIRLIPDAAYQPVPLHPARDPRTGGATDLTFATLRSVSPVHLEYMRNMGTMSSMSVSIIVRGELWGLISCHDRRVRRLPHSLRVVAEHLGQLVSLQIQGRENVRGIAHGLQLRQLLVAMVSATAESGGALEALADDEASLLRFADASGAAVITAGKARLVGETPPVSAIDTLVEWLATLQRDVYATDRLAATFTPAQDYVDVASGVLAMSVSQIHRHFVIWFRREVVQTVLWAGNPEKPAAPGATGERLHPRQSFATWREELRGRSLPWRDSELAVAAELRHALLNLVLRRAEEVAQLANELGRTNKELEAFSYSVSHDLRAPMRHIAGYADLVREYEGAVLSERGLRFLQNIKDASRFAGTLVDDLLAFSQMGRTTLQPTRVDLRGLVRSIIRNREMEGGAPIDWQVGALPAVTADPVFMQVAVQNLLDNAVKYSSKHEHPRIEISAHDDGTAHVVSVADNGVGFDMRYAHKLFGVFQRLHGVEEFSGTGIGLASVRRAVERHGGSVTAHGELGRGATFTFSIPHTLPAETRSTRSPDA